MLQFWDGRCRSESGAGVGRAGCAAERGWGGLSSGARNLAVRQCLLKFANAI